MTASTTPARAAASASLLFLLPFLGVAVLVMAVREIDPLAPFAAAPPVDDLDVERTVLRPGEIVLDVRNAGTEPVHIAQVRVGDAYWHHEVDDRSLRRFEATTVRIPFPWDEGLPLDITFVTATGVAVVHEIEAAVATPEADADALADYARLGVLVGVVPVAVGMLWLPVARRLPPRSVSFLLAVTLGLLAFLLVDVLADAVDAGARSRSPFGGIELFGLAALVAAAGLATASAGLGAAGQREPGLRVALLVAVGIGLHNLGEGLAVGAAVAAGELAVGSGLVVGFAVHNTTEGLAIVAPMAGGGRVRAGALVLVAAVAGLPTVAGSVAGGAVVAPAFALVALGLAFGAIAEVLRSVGGSVLARRDPVVAGAGFAVGLAAMYGTGLLAA